MKKKPKNSRLLYWVTRRANVVAKVGTICGGIGLLLSILLYSNLKTDIEELLPDTARSVRDLNEIESRLYSMENIVILVQSNDTQGSKRFVQDLAEKLSHVPTTVVARVEYKIDNEIKFFRDRQALFMNLDDLLTVRDYIKARIAYERAVYRKKTPLPPVPELNVRELTKKYENKLSDIEHFPGGYYATPDEKTRAVVAYVPGKGLDAANDMKAAIEKAVAELPRANYPQDLQVKYTGNVQNLIEESAALVEDLVLSTVVVMVLVTFAMLAFYRSAWATLTLVSSLLVGTCWTFGIAYLAIGYLNANTAFLASIVIGNGINFGIIILARYMEERQKGRLHVESINIAIRATMMATITAALAAGFSYGSLILTGFRGFSQFGVIGLMGMVLCWLSAYTILPAYLTLLNKRYGKRWLPKTASKKSVSRFLGAAVARTPLLIATVSLIGVFAAASTLHFKNRELIETDLSKLRDKRSMESGSGALYHYIDDIFGHSTSPMVVLPDTRDDARKIAALFHAEQEREGEKSLITSVQTLDDFLPTDQRKKSIVLNEINDLLSPDIMKKIPPEYVELVKGLTNPAARIPFREKDLPPLVMVRFREANGVVGNVVLVDKQIERGGDSSRSLTHFVSTGRQITDFVEKGAPVAGGLPITYDMYQSIMNDGPRATLFAFLAVVILVILLFRNFKLVTLSLFALVLGVFWLVGLILGFHLKINFLNFVALPITFGIGIDYGVNIFQRYREEGAKNIVSVIQHTGGAVMLCSLTTIIGYSSLLIAGNQAFVSFGRLAVYGELTCVSAAVISLPAFLLLFQRQRQRS